MLAPAEAQFAPPPMGGGIDAPGHRVRARELGLRPMDEVEVAQDTIGRALYNQVREQRRAKAKRRVRMLAEAQ
eukprot:6215803-Alexandrium_andersonii.AAC.1